MKEYVVYIEKIIETEHYVYAESVESAESIVYDFVLNGKSGYKIISHDLSEDIEVTGVYMSNPQT